MVTENIADIMKSSVCLSVRLSQFGVRRKVSSQKIKTAANPDMVYVGKKILESPQLEAIATLFNDLRKYLRSRCLPARMFRHGIYLLPIPLVKDVDRKISQTQVDLAKLVEMFATDYPKLIEAAKDELKDPTERDEDGQLRYPDGLFDPRDYPSIDRLRNAFMIASQYITFGVPGELKDIDAEIYKREITKAEQRVAAAAEEIVGLLRTEFAGLVERLKETLTPGPDGKYKRFYATSVTNLLDFMEVFSQRNITGDGDLARLVEDAKQALGGIDVDNLKKSEDLKANIQKAMSDIALNMQPLTQGRARLDEEDDDATEEAPAA